MKMHRLVSFLNQLFRQPPHAHIIYMLISHLLYIVPLPHFSLSISVTLITISSLSIYINPIRALKSLSNEMPFTWTVSYEVDQVVFEDSSSVRKVILNRPRKLNCLNFAMVSEMLAKMKKYEHDPAVSCVILKANGKAFSAGGDVIGAICSTLGGHWSYALSFYRKQFQLDYLIATFPKPVVALIHGIVMGGGAGLSLQATFRIVTENTVFAMPETSIGFFPDVGASYFLSRLPGYFGEYLALTCARLTGAEMVACGLASHFVLSKDLTLVEKTLCEEISCSSPSSSSSVISQVIERFAQAPPAKQDILFRRLETINKCFSRSTIEEMFSSLEKEMATGGGEKWMEAAYKSMKAASPTSLKVTLKSIREGRRERLDQCLQRELKIATHMMMGSVNRDFYEGARALLFDRDKKPKWEHWRLEMVSEEMVNVFFTDCEATDDTPRGLQLNLAHSKL